MDSKDSLRVVLPKVWIPVTPHPQPRPMRTRLAMRTYLNLDAGGNLPLMQFLASFWSLTHKSSSRASAWCLNPRRVRLGGDLLHCQLASVLDLEVLRFAALESIRRRLGTPLPRSLANA